MSHSKNMTVGNPLRLIVLFAIPLMIGNTFLQFSTMLESSIVGRFAGVNGTAAIGATAGLYNVILGFTQGLAAGLPILIAHRYGAQDERGSKKASARISSYVSGWRCFLPLSFSLRGRGF